MKGVVWGIVLAISAGSLYMLWQNPSQTSYESPTQEPPGKGVVGNATLDEDPFAVTITYTDDGFTPRDISIVKGTRVRFVNHSSEETWPASAIHPTHTLYPEKQSSDCLGSSFDSCDALQKGEFFDFTFNYIGEWRFHDHLRGYHTGTITVTAPTSTPAQ